MDQHFNNGQYEFLWELLANPANDAHFYENELQELVNQFPQSGILHALLAHAAEEKNLKRASAYFNPNSLFKLINTPSAFPAVSKDQIITQNTGKYSSETDVETGTQSLPVLEAVQAGEDETYNEIVDVDDISTEQTFSEPAVDRDEELPVADKPETDFFTFGEAIGDHKEVEDAEGHPYESIASEEPEEQLQPSDGMGQDVSKYHDEKMPYTFMWWLDKTRKEHAGPNQPYIQSETGVSNTGVKHTTDELQHQYYENIFHLNSVEDLNKNTATQTVEFDMKRKEDVIIKRFIQEEPQIKPQSSDKLDNENKAKKSSEDQDELVTETLADIYTDQMLYHKAIASYKKLMLKFPEKSRYFAGKIEQLEKKTN